MGTGLALYNLIIIHFEANFFFPPFDSKFLSNENISTTNNDDVPSRLSLEKKLGKVPSSSL
jgi:hypothetical protein